MYFYSRPTQSNVFLLIVTYLLLCANLSAQQADRRMYICTASDHKFFPHVINLIGSIHKVDYDDLGEVCVFDLGMKPAQKKYLASIAKTSVRSIEMVHPQLLKQFNTRPGGKPVPGWYAWKPVAIKQMLESFPHALWIDGGATILRSLRPLFDHILEHNYFFHNGCNIPIKKQLTKHLIRTFDLTSDENSWILESSTRGLEAGLQGYTRMMWDTMIMPMYELAKDLKNFSDDGSAPGGFGNARHDTSLYSVVVNLQKLHIHQHGTSIHMPIELDIKGEKIPFHITFDKSALKPETTIYISRHDINLNRYKKYLRLNS